MSTFVVGFVTIKLNAFLNRKIFIGQQDVLKVKYVAIKFVLGVIQYYGEK